MTTWFCDAYASWQKGGIENANGRLRRWLPRHLDIDRTSDQDIQEIVLTTNLTPVNASGSRRHSKPCLPSLERTFKSASPKRVALRSESRHPHGSTIGPPMPADESVSVDPLARLRISA